MRDDEQKRDRGGDERGAAGRDPRSRRGAGDVHERGARDRRAERQVRVRDVHEPLLLVRERGEEREREREGGVREEQFRVRGATRRGRLSEGRRAHRREGRGETREERDVEGVGQVAEVKRRRLDAVQL